MKILITGCCGHIGSALMNHLLEVDRPDYAIIGVDNMSAQRYCSLMEPALRGKIKFREERFENTPLGILGEVDAVVHLAAVTNAPDSVDSPEDVEYTNGCATADFIDNCKEAGVPLFVFPSSTSIYGEAGQVDEETKPNPQSPYASTKIVIEKYLRMTSEESPEFKHIIFRFGTIFGYSPGVRFHTAVQKFCWQAVLGQKLTVWRQNWKQVRSYLGINDACRAIMRVLPTPLGWTKLEDVENQTFNVLTKNLTPQEVVKIISAQLPIEIDFVDTPLLNQYSYEVNGDKISRTGFVAYDSLEYQVKKMISKLDRLYLGGSQQTTY